MAGTLIYIFSTIKKSITPVRTQKPRLLRGVEADSNGP